MKQTKMSAAEVRELFDYDPETGVFRWRVDFTRKCRQGSVAGCVGDRGYVRIRVNGALYRAHRLAWLYVYGEWPDLLDHINGVRNDNRIANLRLTTIQLNAQNMRRPSRRNTTGFLGVSRQRTASPSFKAAIQIDGSTKSLGIFATPEEAHDAYVRAKRELHPSCTL